MSSKKIKVLNPSLMSTSDELDRLRAEIGGSGQTGRKGGYKYVKASSDEVELISITDPRSLPSTGTQPITRTQTITIMQKSSIDEDDSEIGDTKWEDFVKKTLAPAQVVSSEDMTTGAHIDTYAMFRSSITAEEALTLDADFPEVDSGVDYVYNFLDTPYERTLNTTKKHTVIPNLYVMTLDSVEADADPNVLRAGSLVPRLYKNRRESYGAIDLREKYKNQLVPMENNSILKDYDGNKYLFPMYSQINVPLHVNNDIAMAVKDSNLGCMLTRDIHGAYDGVPPDTVGYENYLYSFVYYDGSGNRIIEPLEAAAQTVDLLRWLDEDAPSWGTMNILPDHWSYLGPDQRTSTMIADGFAPWAVAAGIDTLRSNIYDLATTHERVYEDLLSGEQCYSETLMYKVTKFRGANINNPIQTFHFMNMGDLVDFMSEERKIAFVDTQVKYGQDYTYSVVGYEAIIGTKYIYKNVQTYPPIAAAGFDHNRWAEIDVEMTPLIKLVEVPLFISMGKILDNPPLDPEVSFRPLKGDPNSLVFFLNTNTGTTEAEPIALTDEEAADMSQVMFNQKRNDGKITFGTDDHNVRFRVYRTDTPPLDYGDFADKLIAVASTIPVNGGNTLTASSAAIKISQIPNKKYYYMFRSVDYHGGLSNPSVVYEIELYNDGGVGYPIIREYLFDSIDPKTTTKSARKLIQIVPRITQAYINEPASGLTDTNGSVFGAIGNRDIVLGIEDEPLFGKKFKIRLTSKTTGKKLDINVDFKTKRVRGVIE